jgi:hypothetical protein
LPGILEFLRQLEIGIIGKAETRTHLVNGAILRSHTSSKIKSNLMRRIFIAIAFLAFFLKVTNGQESKETVQALSAKAQKGYLYDVSKDENGNTNITYQMKLDKKSEVISYEKYSFDKDIKFIGASDVQVAKEQHEDRQVSFCYAYIGGTTSFDVLSQKLKLFEDVSLETWNHAKQKYVNKKIISSVAFKPKNDNGKAYVGYAAYYDVNQNLFAIVKADSKDKGPKNFLILTVNDKMEIKEMNIDLTGSYSLVYSDKLDNDNVVMVFAPNKGEADLTKYVYFQFDIAGNQLSKIEFKSPATALLISAVYEKEGAIYFFATSTISVEPFNKVFNEYVPIYNPGSRTSGMAGSNQLDVKWRKSCEAKMDNFHLLKFSSKLDFATTIPVVDFKAKFKTAPGDKGASVYKGKKFYIENFYITPSGDYMIAGQLSGTVTMGTGNALTTFNSYEDIVCFNFDKDGNFKAQYGIGKVNNDKASEIFDMVQNFYPSSDGKNLYWEILEVKGDKDWYTGVPSPVYFPRIIKIDLTNSTLGAIKELGGDKYYLRPDFTSQYDKTENSVNYIGHDEKWKNLWIGKIVLQ